MKVQADKFNGIHQVADFDYNLDIVDQGMFYTYLDNDAIVTKGMGAEIDDTMQAKIEEEYGDIGRAHKLNCDCDKLHTVNCHNLDEEVEVDCGCGYTIRATASTSYGFVIDDIF